MNNPIIFTRLRSQILQYGSVFIICFFIYGESSAQNDFRAINGWLNFKSTPEAMYAFFQKYLDNPGDPTHFLRFD